MKIWLETHGVADTRTLSAWHQHTKSQAISLGDLIVIATYRIATIPHDWHTIVRLRSSKVNDFNVIWKPIFDFLLVIKSSMGPILHCLATIHPLQRKTDDDGRQPCKTPTTLLLLLTARDGDYVIFGPHEWSKRQAVTTKKTASMRSVRPIRTERQTESAVPQ